VPVRCGPTAMKSGSLKSSAIFRISALPEGANDGVVLHK